MPVSWEAIFPHTKFVVVPFTSPLQLEITHSGCKYPDRVHSHSVRIGGATVLAAAQVPDYVIMVMGGWASTVYLQYVRPSLQLYVAAQAALANAGYITAQSIRAMHSHETRPSYDRDLFVKPAVDGFQPLVQFAGILDL